MTPEKAAAFIRERVVGRPKRHGGRKSTKEARNDADGEGEVAVAQPLSSASVNLYIAAVVKLWDLQKRSKINSYPHPRDGPLKELTKSLNREKTLKRKNEFVDRGVGDFGPLYCESMSLISDQVLCSMVTQTPRPLLPCRTRAWNVAVQRG